ncbi:ABC-three component system middle component 4 [Rouxiella badensis]|uniref:ABC-three component system middle component 4 n=1 Tax=Rouxiella badensis TaxID=1646377 RepID=UPI00301BBC51
MNTLPYIPLDEELNLNICLLVILIHSLSKNKNDIWILNKNKAQIFMYLIKNPSRLEDVMTLTGKKNVSIDMSETYTIKSLSLNVDILFETAKINTLLKKLALMGGLSVKKNDDATYFSLTDQGEKIYNELDSEYFRSIKNYTKSLEKIKSLSSCKLNSILNEVFKVSK